MTGAGSRHPGYDSDTDSIPFGELWTSISHRRVATADAAMGATIYVREVHDGYRIRKVNKSGAFCWERDFSNEQAKAVVKDALETTGGSLTLGDRADIWPADDAGYGGGY